MGEDIGKACCAGDLCPDRGVLLWLGEVKTRWQYLMRYSVTTACTATPCRASTPPHYRAGLRSRLGAHTMARFLAVIPVSECLRESLCRCFNKNSNVV